MSYPKTVGLSGMFTQSIEVLTRPSVAVFDRYERSGTLAHALMYVALVALAAGVIGFLTGLFGGAPGARFVERAVVTLVGFLVFSGVTYAFGRSRGGTGTFSEVAYTLALSYVPIALIVSAGTVVLVIIPILGWILIPIWLLLGILAQVFYAHLAVQASLNLRDLSQVGIIMLVAAVITWIVQVVVTRLI